MNENNKPKVAFFGTSDRSVPILEALKANFDLCLCVTKCDTKVGRHQELKECGVKKWAAHSNVYFLEIPGFSNEEIDLIIAQIEEQKIDLIIVCDFAFIIPYKLVEALRGRVINIHFSLLPKLRGASPVQFSLLNGDKTTGITFYLIDKGMDDGAIIAKYEYTITNNVTSGELYALLFNFAGEKLPSTIKDYLGGKLTPVLQDSRDATYSYPPTHPKSTYIYKEDARIDWSKSPEVIEREIRAYNPWPISWGRIGELEGNPSLLHSDLKLRSNIDTSLVIKIFSAELENKKLDIKEIQVEGKSRTNWETFKNGYLAATTA